MNAMTLNIIIPLPDYDRISLDEFKTDDEDIYLVMNADQVYRNSNQNKFIIVSFEREYGYLSRSIYEVVFERDKIPDGENENSIREGMKEFGLAQLRKVLASGVRAESETSPEGYVFQNKMNQYIRILSVQNEFRTRLARLLDNSTSPKLTRIANDLFPSPDSQKITLTLQCLSYIYNIINDRNSIPDNITFFSRTDVPIFLSLLDELTSKLNEISWDVASTDERTSIISIVHRIDELHLKYKLRNTEIQVPDIHIAQVNESISLLDRLHEKRPQLDEVLSYLKSFSESKDQARKDILGNISKIFDRRTEQISTWPWILGGFAFALISIGYMLWAWGRFSEADSWSNTIIRLAIFSVFSYLTIFCFRQYVYERKAREIYEFKQTALNAMGSLLEVHKGNENQTNQIMTYALPQIFNESNVNSDKQHSQEVNQTMLLEIIKSVGQKQ